MNKVLLLAAASEAATGLALLMVPSLVGRLLLGQELAGVAAVVGRVTGMALIALGLACLSGTAARPSAVLGMASYGLLVSAYFFWLGVRGEFVGPFLWPAAIIHLLLTLNLLLAWRQTPRPHTQPAAMHPASPP